MCNLTLHLPTYCTEYMISCISIGRKSSDELHYLYNYYAFIIKHNSKVISFFCDGREIKLLGLNICYAGNALKHAPVVLSHTHVRMLLPCSLTSAFLSLLLWFQM